MHNAKLYFQTEARPGFILLGAEILMFFPLFILYSPLKWESRIHQGHMPLVPLRWSCRCFQKDFFVWVSSTHQHDVLM